MIRIGIVSDTHGFIHPRILEFFVQVEEIWHAGDIGNTGTADALEKLKPLKAVHGNIDGHDLRLRYPGHRIFTVGQARVLLIHVGGHPGRYDPRALELIRLHKPDLFVCGHSHILKVQFDPTHQLLAINPGAAGRFGLHKSVTALRLAVDGKAFRELEVLDIPRSP